MHDHLTNKIYTPEEHLVRSKMYHRQYTQIQQSDKISKHFLTGLEIAQLSTEHLPGAYDTATNLEKAVGRTLHDAQNDYLNSEEWFGHLRQKRFPVTNYIRSLKDIDYTPLPDLFHEYFGHLPQLFQPFFAEIEYKTAWLFERATTQKQRQDIASVSRRTIEYGLLREEGLPKAIGAGILSSPGDLTRFITHQVRLEDATLEKMISTSPSPHSPHERLFVCEDLAQRNELLDTYVKNYMN